MHDFLSRIRVLAIGDYNTHQNISLTIKFSNSFSLRYPYVFEPLTVRYDENVILV